MAQWNRRRLIKTGTLSAGVLLIAALLLIVNYFGAKYYKRFDWTGSHLYSLSEKTRSVLSGLKDDVDVVVLMPPEQRLYEPTRELLSRYAAASRHVRVKLVDPEKNRSLAQQLASKYQVTTAGVVVAKGPDRRVIDATELAEYDFSGMQFGQQQPEMTGFKGEQLLTGAILAISEGRKPSLLFTTGHGEHSLDNTGRDGLSLARDVLARDNFQIEEWASLGKAAVPAKIDLVVIAGPTGSFVKPELEVLAAFLRGGGRLLVMLDPTVSGDRLVQTGLEDWLAGYGVKLGQNIVVDPSNTLPFFGPETIFVKDYGDHPITKPMRSGGLPVLLSLVRSAGKGELPAGSQNTVTELLKSSADGWGETDLAHLNRVSKDASDLAGPVPLAVAVEAKGAAGAAAARPARLVVFGDSDFGVNWLLQTNGANATLVANSVNWLVERENLLSIPARKTEQVRLSLTGGELRTVYVLSLLIMPGLAVAAGVWIHFRRRR
ncbi:MAG TPA: GldG family protein [Thermoanaerobaculia bacterium]|nr:GldG family protein [Thermoanaerobaculia bacterium]